ncbi:MAG: hypothetical protein IPL40_03225 [Proteobacteria bacterium]|nr:hypothetical protein [Pseudomonadota bacterium]
MLQRSRPVMAACAALFVLACGQGGSPLPDGGGAPVVVDGSVTSAPRRYAQVAVGQGHGCAIDADGGLWCFGSNDFGQLGLGDTVARALPTRVGDASWSSVSCGRFHSCAIRSDRSLWCWGGSALGQVGGGAREAALTPAPLGFEASTVEAGDWHSCAIASDARLWCWGFNAFGRLGDGSEDDALRPVAIDGGQAYRAISAGGSHTCGIREDGTLWCWGLNAQGQLGHASAETCSMGRSDAPCSLRPGVTSAVGDWLSVAAGAGHSCGLRAGRRAACWGDGVDGQLGLGAQVTRASTPGELGDDWAAVVAGGFHSCGLRQDGTLWCWGRHASGQLGVGGLASEAFAPLQTGSESAWEAVAAGASGSCGLRQGGALWCWGQLGAFSATLPTYRSEATDR